jgi:hypothetical protein
VTASQDKSLAMLRRWDAAESTPPASIVCDGCSRSFRPHSMYRLTGHHGERCRECHEKMLVKLMAHAEKLQEREHRGPYQRRFA